MEHGRCPGHEGIVQNDLVDSDAKSAAIRLPQPPITSIAYQKQVSHERALREWRTLASKPSHRGHHFLLEKVTPSTHKGGQFMKSFGNNLSIASRAARAILNHAPTGEYRSRFFPHMDQNCPECGAYQDREHILNVCTRYRRERLDFLAFLKDSSHPGEALFSFLERNKAAFSFDDAPPLPVPNLIRGVLLFPD